MNYIVNSLQKESRNFWKVHHHPIISLEEIALKITTLKINNDYSVLKITFKVPI